MKRVGKGKLSCRRAMLSATAGMIGLCAMSVTGAQAQTASAAGSSSGSADDPSASASGTQATAGIADIIVTASRRAENVQKAALSIQALSNEALVRANVAKPEDLAAVAPGVTVGTVTNHPQVYIRGIGNFLGNAYSDAAVPFNLDGVVISSPWAARGIFYDLARIEVLKGPQGTLYGRNATGGAINVISAKPELGRLGGFGEFQAGNYDLFQATAALNLPLGETVAIRASGSVISRDGYLSDGFLDDKTKAARLQLLWKPNTDVSLLLEGNYQHIGGKGSGGAVLYPVPAGRSFVGSTDPSVAAILAAQPFIGPLLPAPKPDGYLDADIKSVNAELNWDLGPATLTVLPAYREGTFRDSSYAAGFNAENNIRDKQTSIEVRLGNVSDALKWTVGGYYFRQNVSNLSGEPSQAVRQGISASQDPDFHLRTLSYAFFGQATYSLSDRFRVTGGLRYTHERKLLSGLLNSYKFPDPEGNCAPGLVFDPATIEVPLFCRLDIPLGGRLSYNNVSFKAGLEFDVAPDSMAYATISTGFKSGSFFDGPPPNSFKPEKMTAYEVGIKNRFFDNQLQVNVEAFYWRYKDLQEAHVGPSSNPDYFAFLTENGDAETYGADLDVVFRPTSSDEFSAKVQYNKTKFLDFKYSWLATVFGPPAVGCAVGPLVGGEQIVDCTGKPLPRAPKWSGTVGYAHTFDLGEHGSLRAGIDTQFASRAYLYIDFRPQTSQKAYAIGNFNLEWKSRDERLTIAGFVNNFTDEVIADEAFGMPFVTGSNPLTGPKGLIFGSLRPPRTFGGRVKVEF